MSRYSTMFEEEVAKKEVHIKVSHHRLLKRKLENGVLGSSWWRECKNASLKSYCKSVKILRSSSCQEQLAISKHKRGASGTVVDKEGPEEEEHVCSYENSISEDIFYDFADYRPLCGKDDVVDRSIMQLACLDP